MINASNITYHAFPNIHWPCKLDDKLKQQLISINSVHDDIDILGLSSGKAALTGAGYVLSGLFSICIPNTNMDSLYGLTVGAKDWLGAIAVEDYPAVVTSVDILKPVKVLFFPTKEINKIAKNNDQVYKWLYSIVRINHPKWLQMPVIAKHKIKSRIAFALIDLALHFEEAIGQQLVLNYRCAWHSPFACE